MLLGMPLAVSCTASELAGWRSMRLHACVHDWAVRLRCTAGNLAGLGSVDSLVAVKAQNRQLEGECQSLRIQLSELKGQLQSSQRSPRHLSTVQIPGEPCWSPWLTMH